MAIFACLRCGYMYEFLVSNSYLKKLAMRHDHCAKCDKLTQFRFVTHTGMVGALPNKPVGSPPPSPAALWWKKKRDGKTASAPLDAVCKRGEW